MTTYFATSAYRLFFFGDVRTLLSAWRGERSELSTFRANVVRELLRMDDDCHIQRAEVSMSCYSCNNNKNSKVTPDHSSVTHTTKELNKRPAPCELTSGFYSHVQHVLLNWKPHRLTSHRKRHISRWQNLGLAHLVVVYHIAMIYTSLSRNFQNSPERSHRNHSEWFEPLQHTCDQTLGHLSLKLYFGISDNDHVVVT